MNKKNMYNQVPSVYKAFKILESISENNECCMGISEIKDKLNFPKSSIHSILNTMLEMGYVRKEKTGNKYGLGIRLHELGNAYRSQLKFMEIFSSISKKIREKCNETVYLAVLDGTDIVYMGREESFQPLRMAASVGTRLPAHVTSLGKVLLSQKQEGEIKELYKNFKFIKYTDTTIMNVTDLLENLRKVKKKGYALDVHEQNPDVDCFGAPIFNDQNEVIAAMSIAVPITRITEITREKLLKLIIEGARKFSSILGSLDQ